jgi:SWI/SNF-related matrix-associated actin-dependent regulator of chromatin subfamily A member 5
LVKADETIQGHGEGSSSTPAKTKRQETAERQQKKQKRKAAEGKLQVKRQEMDKAKVRFTAH